MKRYESYKDSGVKWLGEIPGHWEVKRLGSFFIERRVKVSDKDFAPLSVTKNGIFPQLENVAKSNDGDNRKLVRANDFVINSRSDRKGSSGVSSFDGSVSLINIVLKPRNTVYPTFCNYLLKSIAFIEEYYRNGRGIVADLWTTRFDEMKIIKLAMPPKSEQTAIANYLDSVTSKIDEAISQQQKMIDLLNERKQIIIQNAVTKGLDPNAKMKDSGVEWIGEIPENWEVRRLRNYLRIFSEKGYSHCQLLSVTREMGVILRDKENIEENHNFVPDDLSGYKHINKGDFVINKMKSWQGSYGLSDYEGIVSPAYFTCKLSGIDKKYFSTAIRSKAYIGFFNRYSKGIRLGQWDLDPLSMKEIPFIEPPLIDQQKIYNYLSEINKVINIEIEKCNKMISLLQERKQIIINDVVTGKVKVI